VLLDIGQPDLVRRSRYFLVKKEYHLDTFLLIFSLPHKGLCVLLKGLTHEAFESVAHDGLADRL
jgi:hypothetical protein